MTTRAGRRESIGFDPFRFEVPDALIALDPPEERGLRRDDVRMLVSSVATGDVCHQHFTDLPDVLDPGDVVVINTSGTLPAALSAVAADGRLLAVHLSTHLPGDLWIVELRLPSANGSTPFFAADVDRLMLPDGASARLLAPYAMDRGLAVSRRLWLAELSVPGELHSFLHQHGKPITYGPRSHPIERYQTVFANEPGSAEMPSAGRAFSPELIARLVSGGIEIAPLLLHTGVSSPEAHEPPYEEYYRVPDATAARVTSARAEGRRVVAVGTTAVRALETVVDSRGAVHPGEGWTRLVVTPRGGVRSVDGLLTGWHEPRSSHLSMIEAIAGRPVLETAYAAALEHGYLWHEFGDLHLIL
ncbi:MAG: S-adenosylmethionine:tRNA ribosyltransferase-isomerase [Actinomycetota bacterium]